MLHATNRFLTSSDRESEGCAAGTQLQLHNLFIKTEDPGKEQKRNKWWIQLVPLILKFLLTYRISGNIGDELNLAVWRSKLEPPNLLSPMFNTWRSLQVRWANRQTKISPIFMNARFGNKSPNLMPTNITTYTVCANLNVCMLKSLSSQTRKLVRCSVACMCKHLTATSCTTYSTWECVEQVTCILHADEKG